jgi:hypothetical protein
MVDFFRETVKKHKANDLPRESSEEGAAIVNELYRRNIEVSIYLMMQVLNKVVSEHTFPFPKFVQTNDVIRVVAGLSELKSKLVDLEVVKFYKNLLKTKDRCYLAQLVNRNKNLMDPLMGMFEDTY